MLFSNSVISLPSDIVFVNLSINQTNCIKLLGLFIDAKLSWNDHVNYLYKLISRNIGIINKLKYFVPSKILYNINALIIPYISYGILAWGNTSTCLLTLSIPLCQIGSKLHSGWIPWSIFVTQKCRSPCSRSAEWHYAHLGGNHYVNSALVWQCCFFSYQKARARGFK